MYGGVGIHFAILKKLRNFFNRFISKVFIYNLPFGFLYFYCHVLPICFKKGMFLFILAKLGLFRISDVGTIKLQYLSPTLSDLTNFSSYLLVRSLGRFLYKKLVLSKFVQCLLFPWLNIMKHKRI